MLLVIGSFFREVVNYLECSFAVVLVDVIFYFATLLFNLVFLGSLHAPLYCVVNLSVLSSTLSGAVVFLQLSPFVKVLAQLQAYYQLLNSNSTKKNHMLSILIDHWCADIPQGIAS